MQTPSLKFWGFKKHPFVDAPLSDANLDLFVNRDEELGDLEEALINRVTRVYGSLGVGKSTFLQRFAANAPERDWVVVWVHLPTDAEDRICREVLGEVLTLHLKGQIRTRKALKLEAAKQLDRLDGTVAYDRVSGTDSGESGSRAKQPESLDETGARRQLAKIIDHLETPLVVVLDDFHSLNLGKPDGSYFYALGRWTNTIHEYLKGEEISFVLTLDSRIEDQIDAAKKSGGGAFSFSIGDFIALRPFHPAALRELIQLRLAKHRRKVQGFISPDAFYALALCTEGHPRRALKVLVYAMQDVMKNAGGRKNAKRIIKVGNLATAASKAGETLDKTDLAIIRYLAEHGPTSASDEAFLREIGISRTSLRPRLEKLHESLQLELRTKKVGRTRKKEYGLPRMS